MKQKSGMDVRRRREELMLGKTELARMAGVSVQTINRIESGQSFRSPSLCKIVDALRQSCDQYHQSYNEAN